MTSGGPKNPFSWENYERGRLSPRQESTGSFASSRIRFNDSPSAVETERLLPSSSREQDTADGELRHRRSSISMRINSLTQLGGLNSLENFARSWQRAATFLDQPAQRPTILIDDDDEEGNIGSRQQDISPTQQRSILRQQLEREASSSEAVIAGEHEERDQLEPVPTDSTPRRSDGLDHTPLLASSYASSFGGAYGSLSSHANDSALRHAGRLFDEQQAGAQGDLDKEREPLLVKRVQQEDGSVVHQIVGQSTLYQTVFNSVNVLIGIGTLSLPLGFRYSGWLIGMALLFSAALATNYTAKLLAKCLDRYPAVSSFSELASAAFGPKARLLVEVLIDLELTAACVALIILFADSLNDLIPGWEIVEWKVLCGVVVLPLNFLPLRYLGLTSILGIFCSSGIIVLVCVDGFIKSHSSGSLLDPAITHLLPYRWSTLPLSFGLIMALWGGHTVFPAIYRDMRHPHKYKKGLNITFSFTYLVVVTMAVAGYLMFGESVREEITSNILLTEGYPRAITIVIVVFIAIIPLTKLPLNARPIIRSIDGFLGVDPAKVPFSSRFVGLSSLSRGLLRIAIRIFTTVVILLIAIIFPSFDTIMALMGSVLCFGICIIYPLALYLKIFGHRISRKERILDWFLMVISAVLAILGTVWALIPRRITEPG